MAAINSPLSCEYIYISVNKLKPFFL